MTEMRKVEYDQNVQYSQRIIQRILKIMHWVMLLSTCNSCYLVSNKLDIFLWNCCWNISSAPPLVVVSVGVQTGEMCLFPNQRTSENVYHSLIFNSARATSLLRNKRLMRYHTYIAEYRIFKIWK